MQHRKGYTRIEDIPEGLRIQLNRGEVESQTLAEGLAIDFNQLFAAAFPDLPPLGLDPGLGITRRMALAAQALSPGAFRAAAPHPSDTVRGWAAYWIGIQPCPPPELLARIRPFAADPHFGVREWAWLGIRSRIAEQIHDYLTLLSEWTRDPDANVRRFASEATRPRGVWCAHLRELREDPALGLPVLEPLRADPSPYVQDSVANWLNDAAKDHPEWVLGLTDRWTRESPDAATARIVKRAVRSLTPPKTSAAPRRTGRSRDRAT
jgi:3-methyladenine DNA glycosylase AlkC